MRGLSIESFEPFHQSGDGIFCSKLTINMICDDFPIRIFLFTSEANLIINLELPTGELLFVVACHSSIVLSNLKLKSFQCNIKMNQLVRLSVQQINVMLERELISKQSDHLQNKIDALVYENQLLFRRNELLAEENRKLLEKLQNACQVMMDGKSVEASKLINQSKFIRQKAKEQYHELTALLDFKSSKIVKPNILAYRDAINSENCSFMDIYTHLLRIVMKLLEASEVKKEHQLKEYISNVEQRLAARKNARNRTQKVVHLIKEPSQEINNLNFRVVRQQLNQQKELFEKIIRRIKRSEINSHILESIFGKIDDLMSIRWNIRKEQANLSLIQRQFELGDVDVVAQNSSVQRLQQAKQQQKKLIKAIGQAMNGL